MKMKDYSVNFTLTLMQGREREAAPRDGRME